MAVADKPSAEVIKLAERELARSSMGSSLATKPVVYRVVNEVYPDETKAQAKMRWAREEDKQRLMQSDSRRNFTGQVMPVLYDEE